MWRLWHKANLLSSASPLCRWYCPEPAVKLPCPAGYYCKSGALQPQRCPFLTNCPAGACECPGRQEPNLLAPPSCSQYALHTHPLLSTLTQHIFPLPGPPPPSLLACLPACLPACPAASADLSYSGFIILAVLLVLLWACYAVMRALIRRHERALLRQQEAQDRLWKVLHPLLGPGAQGRCAAASGCLGALEMRGSECWQLVEANYQATTCTF